MPITSPAQALWNQRERIADNRDRIGALMSAVGRSTDLTPFQWAQLLAFALEFRPDLIIELGRERGNSTCCFLEAARLLAPSPCSVVSLCLTDLWQRETAPRLRPLCDVDWFARGRVLTQNLLTFDFAAALAQSRRCLLFWDAHGFDIAECVLGKVLPLLHGREHVVTLHDMTDLRYDGAPPADYDEHGLWKGERDSRGRFWIGSIASHVAQAISVVDFTTRNRIPLHPAAESLHALFKNDPVRTSELRRLLGDDLFSLSAHWFWFSTAEAPGRVVYPPCPSLNNAPTHRGGWRRWLRPARALKRVFRSDPV